MEHDKPLKPLAIKNHFATAPLSVLVGVLPLFFLLAGMRPALAAEAGPLPPWLAYGDVRGFLEPCGCDPATDMGGVKRIMGLLQRERLAEPTLLAFDLGNDLPVKDSEALLKTKFLLEAAVAMQPAAVLFNELEIKYRALINGNTFGPKLPYVLSNMATSARAEVEFVKDVISTPRLEIFGYVRSHESFTKRIDKMMLTTWKKKIAASKKPALLLFSGPESDLKMIVASQIFNEIIASNPAPLATNPGTAERFDERKLLYKVSAKNTPAVYMVPLGGQGVLRGSNLRFGEAKSLGDLLGGKGASPLNLPSPQAIIKQTTLVTWLEPKKVDEEALAELFKRYNEAAKLKFKSGIEERAKDLAASKFVGAEACETCHSKAFATWKGSKHILSMAVLKAKGKDEDGECVACHAVGALAKGGFVSMEKSPHLASVQCESCHGPRREHTQNPVSTAKQDDRASGVCISCHNPTHSPSFDFKTYWLRIQHGKD